MVNDEYNTFNYRLLKKKCEALETENAKLKNSIKKITSDVLAITGEFVND
jgi:wobble nucleotide-excising tRNase